MKIIVTGGAGFIGSNFIFHMLKSHPEDKIICIDKLTYAGNLATLKEVIADGRISFFHMDICDREKVYGLFERERPDVIVNFAAESHVDRSIDNPGIFLFTNTLGTGVLLDACMKYGFTETCRLTALICSSLRTRPYTHHRRILPRRQELTCWFSRITGRTNYP